LKASDFILYPTGFEKYEQCPQKFLWERGWPGIDLGAGPGRRKPKPVQKSSEHLIMGIVIQRVVEYLYNEEVWHDPKTLKDKLSAKVHAELNLECSKNYVNWDTAPSYDELLQTCLSGVHGFVKTMKHNRLLGPYARAEVEILAWLSPICPVAGRADLIISREDTGITILDGKNSKEKGKYTSPDQVRWYAMCYLLSKNIMPNRIGFVYYRFPYGTPKADGGIEEGVDWIPLLRDDLKGLAARAAEVHGKIIRERFDPTPSPKVCNFCDYETICKARQDQIESNRRRKKTETPEVPGDKVFSF
jgi:hypothetical protein